MFIHTATSGSTLSGISTYLTAGSIDRHLGRLRSALDLAADQNDAWNEFAVALRAHRETLDAASPAAVGDAHDVLDQAFGSLEQRLRALALKRAAAHRLQRLMTPEQRRLAARHLPLCCLAAGETS